MANEITTYATVEDLEARWRELSADEQAMAQILIEDVSVRLRMEYKNRGVEIPTDEDGLWALKSVTCAVVKRIMSSPGFQDQLGTDIKEFRTDVGILSETYGFANPDGSLYLKNDELKMLGLWNTGKVYTIDPFKNLGCGC